MQGEDAFDSLHLTAAHQVDAFLSDLEASRRMEKGQARRHGDNAYLFVEFLANTYPKLPRDANERDGWVFLFDYAFTQSSFAGETVRATAQSIGLFVEWLARRERVADLEYLRKACAMQEYFLARFQRYGEIAKAAAAGATPSVEAAIDAWWAELDERMAPRGLVPDHALAGGDETWGTVMGPVEAAVFDAVCVVLMRRARELGKSRADEGAAELELLRLQKAFMEAPNQGLRKSPLAAVREERQQLAARVAARE
jgi:hypothetical protein